LTLGSPNEFAKPQNTKEEDTIMQPPEEPVIPRTECYAALRLMSQLCENIWESGDVEENVVELVRRFQDSFQDLQKAPEAKDSESLVDLQKVPENKDDMAVRAILATGLLPTCHNRWNSREGAGAALLRLIEANLVVYSEF
jgi:hypothetical protein